MRFAGVTKFVLPILVIATWRRSSPGPERLARVLGAGAPRSRAAGDRRHAEAAAGHPARAAEAAPVTDAPRRPARGRAAGVDPPPATAATATGAARAERPRRAARGRRVRRGRRAGDGRAGGGRGRRRGRRARRRDPGRPDGRSAPPARARGEPRRPGLRGRGATGRGSRRRTGGDGGRRGVGRRWRTLAGDLETADLMYLPGGDPDLIPTVLAGSPAWAAMLACPRGGSLPRRRERRGDGAVRAPLDVARADGRARAGFRRRRPPPLRARARPGRGGRRWTRTATLAWIGLEEQTLVIGRPAGGWRVAGAGRAYLLPPGDG